MIKGDGGIVMVVEEEGILMVVGDARVIKGGGEGMGLAFFVTFFSSFNCSVTYQKHQQSLKTYLVW